MSKFLTYEDRLVIAQLLQENVSFGVIGNKLGKDRTTIAKEIKKHSYDKKSGRPGYPYNPCKHRINQRINVVYVPSVHCTAWILQRISVLLKQNRHMYVMAAASFLNAPC